MAEIFDKFKIHKIKAVAALIKKERAKRDKLEAKIKELGAQYDALTQEIDEWEAPIKTMTGGYGVDDLVVEVKENGKSSHFELKYPETVIPPVEMEKEKIEDFVPAPVEEIETAAEEAAFNPIENVH